MSPRPRVGAERRRAEDPASHRRHQGPVKRPSRLQRDENGASRRAVPLPHKPDQRKHHGQSGRRSRETFEITNTRRRHVGRRSRDFETGRPLRRRHVGGERSTRRRTPSTRRGRHAHALHHAAFTYPLGRQHLGAAIAWPSHVGGNAKLAALLLSTTRESGSLIRTEKASAAGTGSRRRTPHARKMRSAVVQKAFCRRTRPAYTGKFMFKWGLRALLSAGQFFPSHLSRPRVRTALGRRSPECDEPPVTFGRRARCKARRRVPSRSRVTGANAGLHRPTTEALSHGTPPRNGRRRRPKRAGATTPSTFPKD